MFLSRGFYYTQSKDSYYGSVKFSVSKIKKNYSYPIYNRDDLSNKQRAVIWVVLSLSAVGPFQQTSFSKISNIPTVYKFRKCCYC